MAIDLGAIGALKVLIGGDTSGLTKALGQADKALAKHSVSMRDAITTAGKYSIAVAAAGAALITALVTRSLQSIDAQAKLARQLNGTIGGLETLRRAADLAGIDVDKLTLAQRRLDVAIGEALQGQKESVETFRQLGLSAAELSKMDVDERILAVNEALKENIPAAQRAAVSAQIFGQRMGTAMSEIDAATIAQARREVEAFGLAVSEVDARTIERANDALSTINEVIRGVGNRLAVAVAPVLENFANWFRDAAIESKGWQDEVNAGVEIFVKMSGFVLDALEGIRRVVLIIADAFAIAMAWTSKLGAAIKGLFGDEDAQNRMREYNDIIAQAQAHIDEILNKPLPSAGIEAFLKKVSEAAKKVSEAQGFDEEGAIQITGGMSDDERKKWEERLETVRAFLRSEEEAERVSHERRLKELDELNNLKFLSDQEYNQLREKEFNRFDAAIDEINAKRHEKEEEERKRKLEQIETLRGDLLTEEEALWESYERKLALLDEARKLESEKTAQWDELQQRAWKEHSEALVRIRKEKMTELEKFMAMSFGRQTATVLGELESLTAGVAQHNKTLFNINKVAGIANAIVKAYEGIALTMSKYPYPLNIGMAALHAAAAFAQVDAIRRTSFEGGGAGAAPSIAGSTAAQPVSPVGGGASGGGQQAPGGLDQTITVQGLSGSALFTGDRMKELVEQLLEYQRQGARVVLTQ